SSLSLSPSPCLSLFPYTTLFRSFSVFGGQDLVPCRPSRRQLPRPGPKLGLHSWAGARLTASAKGLRPVALPARCGCRFRWRAAWRHGKARTKKAITLRGGGELAHIWTFQMRDDRLMWIIQGNDGAVKRTEGMDTKRSEVLQGTLDLMILKTLQALGPLHGFGIARRIEQVSRDVLQLNEGTVYTSLLRLQQRGWIAAEWGTSENNRKAKFYSITKRGQKQLAVE